MPAVNVVAGACTLLISLDLVSSGATPVHGGIAMAVLSVGAILCGMGALLWRVAAGLPVETWRARRRALLADTAVVAGWLPLCLALLLWGTHGLIDDARRSFVIVGNVQELELDRDRGRSARLWIGGVPHAYHWRCRFDCRPWNGLVEVARSPGQRVRATVVGRRLIGLDIGGRRLLSPGPERRRWVLGDVALAGVSGLLVLAILTAALGKVRDLTEAW